MRDNRREEEEEEEEEEETFLIELEYFCPALSLNFSLNRRD